MKGKFKAAAVICASAFVLGAGIAIPLAGTLKAESVVYADDFDGPQADTYGGAADGETSDGSDGSEASEDGNSSADAEDGYFGGETATAPEDDESDPEQDVNDLYEDGMEDACYVKSVDEDGNVTWTFDASCAADKIKTAAADGSVKEQLQEFWQSFSDNIGSFRDAVQSFFDGVFGG